MFVDPTDVYSCMLLVILFLIWAYQKLNIGSTNISLSYLVFMNQLKKLSNVNKYKLYVAYLIRHRVKELLSLEGKLVSRMNFLLLSH